MLDLDREIERILLLQAKAILSAPNKRSAPEYVVRDDIKQLIRDVIEEVKPLRESYVELDYSKIENDDDSPLSKRQIKESRKHRMARVVIRNEVLAEIEAKAKELGL